MSSLRELQAQHAPLLVLDAASTRVQVGCLGADGAARWEISEEEAGIGVFRGVEKLGIDVRDAGAFVFCDGPGSILGIRTVAMALRTWCVIAPRPLFAYTSLAIVAHALDRKDVTIIADARRESWHALSLAQGGALRRVPAAELTGQLLMPENFRHWSPVPANLMTVDYSLAELMPRIAETDLFRPTDAPEAFLHEQPSYVAWSQQIHRAPPRV
jgi:tRNA threonylcarbamoyladenosine biosynthesis protein TsaB